MLASFLMSCLSRELQPPLSSTSRSLDFLYQDSALSEVRIRDWLMGDEPSFLTLAYLFRVTYRLCGVFFYSFSYSYAF